MAFTAPFAIILFRAFVSTIPRELDEAAMIDGCSSFNLYRRVIFPLLRPVIITVIVTASVAIYNDFVNPLYFLPGSDNPTVQLTLFNFQSQFTTRFNLSVHGRAADHHSTADHVHRSSTARSSPA